MSKSNYGRIAAGLLASAALLGLGGGVASAAEAPAPSGTIQEVGGEVSGVEESTRVAQIDEEISDATGVTQIDDELGVTKAEEGLGLG